jgi:hypothetical protein
MQSIIAFVIFGIFLASVIIKPARDWLFGPPGIDDRWPRKHHAGENKERVKH